MTIRRTDCIPTRRNSAAHINLGRRLSQFLRATLALLMFRCAWLLPAQSPSAAHLASASSAELLVVDVHSSPYRSAIYYKTNIGHQRFDMRDATILDMIAFAYEREDDAILGGPSWIDFDRFDVVAKIDSLNPPSATTGPPDPTKPPANPYDQVRPTLKQVLTDRFHLKYHTEDRPMPGYVVTVAKDAKFTEAKDPTEPGSCRNSQEKPTPGQSVLVCTSESIPHLLAMFRGAFPHPTVDRTGLTKPYDFTIKLVYDQLRTREDYIRLYVDAFAKVGLVVTPQSVPQPAIVVDHVDRPTANRPDIAKAIPPPPDLEFEVATIKPPAPNEQQEGMRFAGSQITFSSWSMQGLLVRAWDLPTGAMLGNVPAWVGPTRYTITVKLPPEMDARAVFQDQDLFNSMLRKLLIDRFQIKYHWGEQTGPSFALLPGTPKMKKADPNSRSFCKFGPADGEKDARSAPNSPFDREFHCQNVTMAQFAELVQPLAGSEVKNRVPDKTGLPGAYDFTLFYTTVRTLRVQTAAAADEAKQAGDAAPAPVAGVGVEAAFRRQLGLGLEKQPLTLPALLLDHIEQTPTEN